MFHTTNILRHARYAAALCASIAASVMAGGNSLFDRKIVLGGREINLGSLQPKVLLITNVSACDAKSYRQFKELQQLYMKYKDSGFIVLALPSTQFSDKDLPDEFNWYDFAVNQMGSTFPVAGAVKIDGKDANPLFNDLRDMSDVLIQNARAHSAPTDAYPERLENGDFMKYLVNERGYLVGFFDGSVSPLQLETFIKRALQM